MSDLTHLDDEGHAHMVDVGGKDATHRVAVAEAHIAMSDRARQALFAGELPKGDALAVARVAAIQGAKQTPALVPLCHPLAIDSIAVDIAETGTGARVEIRVEVHAKTGVEMEAITGASVGAITLYDMVKALDKGAVIGPVQLLSKSGGKSGDWSR
ncbi:MAG: cyclic pyranopterin monophosphate synthase MoaC [Acidimicrobiia bacterium]|nr:cyclic pyranopterin monophosphate synthase MoaC [Acidimicrobiia bacterium]